MEDSHVDVDLKKFKNVDSIFTLFSNLTGEKNQDPRYCLELVKSLCGTQFSVGSGSNLEYSIKRITRGLGSLRLHTQCGCFAALTCILKYQACSVEDVLSILEKEQRPIQGATKAEVRALDTGCVLTCGAIIHSGLFVSQPAEVQETIIKKLIEAGKKKSYLSSVIYRFLVDVVNNLDSQQFKNVIWPVLKSDVLENLDECGADAFHLLLVCLKNNCKTVHKYMQKNVGSIISLLEKVVSFLMNNSVKYDHPIYGSVAQIFCTNTGQAGDFWVKCVNENAKNSFHKDAVLLTLFSLIIKNLDEATVIPKLLVPKLIEIIIKVLSFKKAKSPKDEDCSATAKSALNDMITLLCAKTTSNEVRFDSIRKFLFYPSNMKFEVKTGTKLIHLLTSNLNEEFVKKLVNIYRKVVSGEIKKTVDDEGGEENWNSKEKLIALHILTKTLNHPSLKEEISWKLDQIKFIFGVGFLKDFQLPSEVQKCAKDCFYKAVMLQMPSLKDLVVLLDDLALYLNENIKSENLKLTEESIELWDKMFSVVKSLQKKAKNKLFIAVHVLLIYMGLHLFLDGDLAKGGIEELLACYEHLKEVHKKKKIDDSGGGGPHWTEVTVDLILSLLSRENRLWRHVVSCIFPQVVPHITPTALHQIVDALDPKSQNNVLKHVNSDDSESEEESEGESSLSESAGSDLEEYDDEGKVNDQLRMAVRNALGYSAALTDDEDIDMDQMGEEEEKRLNESLGQAFKMFRNKSQGKKKKQTKEEEALTHFRLRVLDLVEIYITSGPSMGGCLDLILPLLDVLELSIKDHHQRPLQNRVDSILKHLSAVKNFSDLTNITQTLIKDVFESVISRKEIPALVFVEMSPRISDCTTFLVRCSQMVEREDEEIPLVNQYHSMLVAFFQSRDFKLPISMFQAVLRMNWMGNYKIVETLFEFLALPNVRIFKKMKIIELLRIFYRNEKLQESSAEGFKTELNNIESNFINNFTNVISEYGKSDSKSSEKMYLSFFSNIITLINFIQTCSKKHRKESKKSPPWKNLVLKMTEIDIINGNKRTRSQLANLANTFGVTLPKEMKRKRTLSESSVQKSDPEDKLETESLEPPKKKKSKKMSAEKAKLKKESRKIREEISANGLEMIRFSAMDSNSLPEPEVEEPEVKVKKKKTKEVTTNGSSSNKFKCK